MRNIRLDEAQAGIKISGRNINNLRYAVDIKYGRKVKVKVSQSCLTPCYPLDYTSMEFSRPEYWSGYPFPSPGDLPNSGIKPRSPALQANSLPAEPPEKFKNTVVGSLSLIQGIFLTQDSNQNFLHCRWTVYQLRDQGKRN